MPTDRPSRTLPAHLARRLPPDADVVVDAPGRANLIGEHTDVNDGFVLPAALELRTVVAGRRADRIRLRSARRRPVEVDPATGRGPASGWGRYVAGVVTVLIDEGYAPAGIDGVVVSDVPRGAGLSSSAALEVAVALAVLTEPIAALDLARICRRVENEEIGVQSGIMDPLASAAGRAGNALLIDCRSLEMRDVEIPEDLRIVVIDSGQRRNLSAGDYNVRRRECEEAARLLGLESLRDATEAAIDRAGLPPELAARARHVVTENDRVCATVDALRADDRPAVRSLFAASHTSLRDDFAVSTPALDALVEIAARTDGVIGARMTGAGFGGCTVNLVAADRAKAAGVEIAEAYERRTGRQARAWVSRAAAGALDDGTPST